MTLWIYLLILMRWIFDLDQDFGAMSDWIQSQNVEVIRVVGRSLEKEVRNSKWRTQDWGHYYRSFQNWYKGLLGRRLRPEYRRKGSWNLKLVNTKLGPGFSMCEWL